jgi:hypothetical protein
MTGTWREDLPTVHLRLLPLLALQFMPLCVAMLIAVQDSVGDLKLLYVFVQFTWCTFTENKNVQ